MATQEEKSTTLRAGGVPPRGQRAPKKAVIAASVAVAALVVFGAYYLLVGRHRVSTDDAFIDGHVLPISSKVAGQVVTVNVTDNQLVKKGDLLVEIDSADYRIALGQAEAEEAAAAALARQAAADAARARQLFGKGAVSEQVRDKAVSEADVSRARAELAKQKAAAARLDLDNTRILAPADGRVARKSAELRTFVQVGQPLLSVVTSDVWVTANFKETQLGRMKPGQKVEIEVDAVAGRTLHGHVDSIQPGTGARFSLFPPENATGNFVKVVQRVPVKILFDEPAENLASLSPGMSAVPEVHLD